MRGLHEARLLRHGGAAWLRLAPLRYAAMADPEALAMLGKGVAQWNRWREKAAFAAVDLSGADLHRARLNGFNFLRADLSGSDLAGAQLESCQLKHADFTGANLSGANLEGASAREADFSRLVAPGANFEVTTLRGARFRGAALAGCRFHRAYLREADLREADLSQAWLRFATLDGARCDGAVFAHADMCHATLVKVNLSGADLREVNVFGISAWDITVDAGTRQELIVGRSQDAGSVPLRAHDLRTAQLLALMLDGDGVRKVFDAVNSKLVLILGSFAPDDKAVLDALRQALTARGYVPVLFDFDRPAQRDYAETVITLAGMSRFVVADFSNAREVRAEVLAVRGQYRRVPIVLMANKRSTLPVTMLNVFSAEELQGLLRYADAADLDARVDAAIVAPAEAGARRAAESLARAEALLRAG